jgi:hypothetical protein
MDLRGIGREYGQSRDKSGALVRAVMNFLMMRRKSWAAGRLEAPQGRFFLGDS